MQNESAHVDGVESEVGVRSSHSTHSQPRTNRASATRNLRQTARRGWQALASGAAVLMVAWLTRLTNGAPRWTLLDSGLDGVHPAANALTTFALVVVVFHALLLVFPLEPAPETSPDLRPAPDALDHRGGHTSKAASEDLRKGMLG
ncbi:MAG: hypothetical protein DMD87_29730 [Candidatus Rokuibacteriota bacterium]|nr:MAG: hypothetical protein DMD87_29730 [Candidatus Rokubacteria bacterium]